MIFLWLFVPGFPLLIFLLFPPIYWWGFQSTKSDIQTEEQERQEGLQQHYCPQCGKRLLEPFQPFCPACGFELHNDK